MPFKFKRLEIPDIILVEPWRGFFIETYKEPDFKINWINYDFVQDSHSKSKKRELHYQLHTKAQGKLVSCIKGRIWYVAVDIRKGSPWFGKWIAVELSKENKLMLWILPGFAHGFAALEDSEVMYKTTAEYDRELDAEIRWNDSDIGIRWPIDNPILSEKDANLPYLKEAKNNFEYGVNSWRY